MKDFSDRPKPCVLCILDGFGLGDSDNPHNAIMKANTPHLKYLLEKFPYSFVKTSGLDVGLPNDQMGNSEVGHMTIGAGRVLMQDLPKIDKAILDGSLESHQHIISLIDILKKSKKSIHLMGLFSDGGVHSHINHIIALAKIMSRNGIKVHIHAFLDGRDTSPKSAIKYFDFFSQQCKEEKLISISTIGGRFYAMDRDKRWERIKAAAEVIIDGNGKKFIDIKGYIEESYNNEIYDEFIIPASSTEYKGIEDGDALIMANFRSDRVIQLMSTLVDPNFSEVNIRKINFSKKIGMVPYSEKLNHLYDILFVKEEVKNSLGEYLSNNNLSQLRIAETEKYAHVTYFFSVGREEKFSGEDHLLIESPKVKTYDLLPEMSAYKITDQLIEEIQKDKYDFIVVNYANCDMVGHTGNMSATIKAVEAIDSCLKKITEVILEKNGALLITADHGNAENMKLENGDADTSHTLEPVPLIYVRKDVDKSLSIKNGNLSDIAPTILNIMKLEKPQEMTGKSLI